MSDECANRAVPFYKTVAAGDADKPWLTMVHGASQHSAIFSAQIPFFQQHFRLLLIDLPGHGRSTSLAGPYGLEEYAACVLAAIDDAGVKLTHFWGTHTGAGAGLLLASRHAERFSSLVLEGVVVPNVDAPSIANTIGRAKATAWEQGIAAARKEWFEQADWFAVMRDNPLQCRAEQHWKIITEFSGAPWLDSTVPLPIAQLLEDVTAITMPVLLINGEHDLPDFVGMADQLAARLPDVQQVMISEAGGFPLWEFPDVVNETVYHFLKKSHQKE